MDYLYRWVSPSSQRTRLGWLALVTLLLAQLAASPIARAAANDDLAAATDISAALNGGTNSFADPPASIAGLTRDAAEVNGLSVCGAYPNTPTNTYSGWYRFTPAQNGWATLDTQGSNYDTVIEVWDGPVMAVNGAVCNDDASAAGRSSEVTLPVQAGTIYTVGIRRHGSSTLPGSPVLAFAAAFRAQRTLFVDQTNGSDGNTGSAVLPFRTIARAANALPPLGGVIVIVDPGVYPEVVTLSVPTELRASAPVSIAGVVLAGGPVAPEPTVTARGVLVQPGARVQDGVTLVEEDGVIDLDDGTFTETVTLDKGLTLKAVHAAQASIKPASGPALIITAGSAKINGLNLQGSTAIEISGGTTHFISYNNLFGNSSGVAIDNLGGAEVDATRNWWGDRSGPQGDGDDVIGDVLFKPWCDSAVPLCSNLIGAATHLRFSTSPGNTRANGPFAAQPVVEAVDDLGTLDANFSDDVTLAIQPGSGTAGATLAGTLTASAAGGVATFSGLSTDYVGQGYRLAASSTALTSTLSAAFNITADRLVVTASPANPSNAGAPLALTVAAQDGAGHTDATFTDNIALAIQNNPGSDTLHGSSSKAASAGVVVFGGAGDAAIFKAGVGYTLRAGSGTLATGDSDPFDIVSQAGSTLVFTTSPADSTAGVAFPTQPVVQVQDAFGNPDPSFNGAITLAITSGTGAPGATLGGITTVNAVNGVASFSGLNTVTAGAGYQLTASASGLTSGDSAGFNISAGAAVGLAVTASPGNTRSGVAFATQPVIAARDTYGNLATSFSGAVTLAIKPGTGTAGAALAGTATVNAVNGVASFSGLSIDKIGTGYVLAASAEVLTPAETGAFDITANGLVFTLQPVDTLAGQTILVKVAAQDVLGNTDTSFTGTVTLQLKNAGRGGATLLGTLTASAVNGEADFTGNGLNITKAGAGYVLGASAGGLATVDSDPFNILAGAATKLVFTTSPDATPADTPFTLTLEAQDAFGNLDTTFTDTVSLAIQVNPGGGALGGTSSKAAVAGYVGFDTGDGLNINRVGVGYVLRASSRPISGDSAPFNITANRLIFSSSPGTSPVGALLRPQPVVQAVDSFGGVDATFSGVVALTIKPGTGAAGANLFGVANKAAGAGIASYSGLLIDRVGSGYQLSAAATGLAGATSAAFNIGQAALFVPLATHPPLPDLVASFKLSAAQVTPFEPVLVTVTVTNTGETAAGQFWADFYINPLNPPTGANQPWDQRCGPSRCRYGIAWYVDRVLAPGESITLTSRGSSYYALNTDWPGHFVTSKLDLYLYVDSWNKDIPFGAVYERNEANNRSELHLGSRPGPRPAAAAQASARPALPERPRVP